MYSMTEAQLQNIVLNFLTEVNPMFNQDWISELKVFKAPVTQHIVTKDYQPPKYETGIKNVFFGHFSQIYPHDRGVNYAIAEARELFKLINRN